MKPFWTAAIGSYLLVMTYLFLLFPNAVKLLNTPEKTEVASNLGFFILGFFILPPLLGSVSYLIISRYRNNPHRPAWIVIPYYFALYQVSSLIAMAVVGGILNRESFELYSWQGAVVFGMHFLLITMMMYVITPRNR